MEVEQNVYFYVKLLVECDQLESFFGSFCKIAPNSWKSGRICAKSGSILAKKGFVLERPPWRVREEVGVIAIFWRACF